MSSITRESITDTIEGLEGLANRGVQSVYIDMAIAGMRHLLTALTAEPVAWRKFVKDDFHSMLDSYEYFDHQGMSGAREPLYTAPPAPVVDADDNFYSWFGREWHEHYQQNQYTTAAKQMLGVMAESAWKAGRAAMLQGKAEPVSQRDELRKGIAAIRNSGIAIDAEKIQAERDELPEGCGCRTCRPVTITDMRFVVCPDCGNKRCPRANDHRNACTVSNEPGQKGSAYPAAPQQGAE